jgi:hypothetical protein
VGAVVSFKDKAMSQSDFGLLGRIAKRKLENDNDVKIIIVGKNSQTGIGKTTLAIQLCRFIDPNWSAEDSAYIRPQPYLNEYLEKPAGSAMLLDEIEHGADRRRSQSHENVDLSQGWAKLRARNIATVATSPSMNMVDRRMLELADFWVLVKRRGLAQPYQIKVNDFNGKMSMQPLPGDEHIRFRDIGEEDPDKAYLDEIKDDIVTSDGDGWVTKEEMEERVTEAKSGVRTDVRNQFLYEAYEQFDVTYSELCELPSVDIETPQGVGEVVRKIRDEN